MKREETARQSYRTLHRIVVDHLTADIVTGRFLPGQKLNETDLAELYDVSRGPIREAIRLLEAQGLVKVTPGKGATVALLSRDEVEELYDIRIELEGLATRLASRHIDDRALKRMEACLQRMESTSSLDDAWMKANDEFHMTLYRASNRRHLCALIDDLFVRTKPYARLYLTLSESLPATNVDHRRIFEAVQARDEKLAEELMHAHIRVGPVFIAEMATDE